MLHNLLAGLQIQSHTAHEKLMHSPAITTALLPLIGYEKATKLAQLMKTENISIIQANEKLGMIEPKKLEKALLPENLLKLGYSLNDL